LSKRLADTTALFELHAGTASTRKQAQKLLQPTADVETSEHVLREWKRILFEAVRVIEEAADTEPDVSALLSRMALGYFRQPAQRLRALAIIVGGSSTTDMVAIKVRAGQLLRGDAERLLRASVSAVKRTSDCGLAKQVAQQTPSGWTLKVTCKKREGICGHEERIEQQLARWRAGAAALRASDRYATMGTVAEQMAASPRDRTGSNCFNKTGDLAIAMDCNEGDVIVTTDRSFETMAQAMNFGVARIDTTQS
jgi:hypothetical protein